MKFHLILFSFLQIGMFFSVSALAQDWFPKKDPKTFNQWAFNNANGPDINIQKVWKEGLLDNIEGEVIVAVLDTGVDYNHEDLRENIWVNEAEKNGIKGVDDDGNGFFDDIHGYDFAYVDADPMDGTYSKLFGEYHTHGTFLAGLIAASHNGVGISGVGKGKIKIMPIKVGNMLIFADRYEKFLVPAIEYAVKMGAKVINLSSETKHFFPDLEKAIKAAERAGVLVVTAAGNSQGGLNNDEVALYPANFEIDSIISVGSINQNGERSDFSNYGKKTVDIFAPGERMFSTVTSHHGYYASASGTSYAASLVSAAAALLFLKYPELTPLQVKKHLMATAVRSKKLENYTASGYLDIYSLLTMRL